MFILFCLCAGFVSNVFGSEGKRLLLTDPSVVQDRFNRMESMFSHLNNTVTQQAKTIQQQTAEIKQLRASAEFYKGTGSTYVIWGRKQCPTKNYTEQVYSGFVGGGMYDQTGSPAEYVCLPPDPDFGKTSAYDGGRMYGAEYQGNANDWSTNAYDEDVPCAVCRNTITTSTIVIPGKNTCYSGWTLEYFGYLGSGYHAHSAASSYVCVDIHPENLNAGKENKNGKLIYDVLAKCGSLQCPPYRDNYPLTCVVCSK